MLIGFFLFSGDQGGVEQKNRVRPYFDSRGLSPRNEEVLHDTFQSITEYSFMQAGLVETEKESPNGLFH
jgi:hypothetical protein